MKPGPTPEEDHTEEMEQEEELERELEREERRMINEFGVIRSG